MAKILIVEDDQQLRNLICSYLQRENHDVNTAENGQQAIKMLTNEQIDLVITDIIMPEKDGFEVLMWLMIQPDRPKVIAITGGSPGLDVNVILDISQKLKADKVLAKPVALETLNQAITDLLA